MYTQYRNVLKKKYGEDEELSIDTQVLLDLYKEQPKRVNTKEGYEDATINSIAQYAIMKSYQRQFGGGGHGGQGWRSLYYQCIIEKSIIENGVYPPDLLQCDQLEIGPCQTIKNEICVICGF